MNKINDQHCRRLCEMATILLMVLVALVGCRGKTRPISYYTLSPIQADLSDTSPQPVNNISIGIGPVSFPEYINKPQIVTREGTAGIRYAEFHRWAGFLEKAFLRVMAENLSVILDTDSVYPYPWSGLFTPQYQIKMDVKQFDGQINGQVTLNVIWQLTDNLENRPATVRRSVITESTDAGGGNKYDRLVSAQSRALEQLSREIAAIINEEKK